MKIDLAPYEIAILDELLKERRTNTGLLISTHEGHFPSFVKRRRDIDIEAVGHCHNRWCRLGQINILIAKMGIAQAKINEGFETLSFEKIVHPNKEYPSDRMQRELDEKLKNQ